MTRGHEVTKVLRFLVLSLEAAEVEWRQVKPLKLNPRQDVGIKTFNFYNFLPIFFLFSFLQDTVHTPNFLLTPAFSHLWSVLLLVGATLESWTVQLTLTGLCVGQVNSTAGKAVVRSECRIKILPSGRNILVSPSLVLSHFFLPFSPCSLHHWSSKSNSLGLCSVPSLECSKLQMTTSTRLSLKSCLFIRL